MLFLILLSVLVTDVCAIDVALMFRGHHAYNPSSQLCCRKQLSDTVGPEMSCCLDTPYNTSLAVCCKDVVVPVPEGQPVHNYACCLGALYNVNTEKCCKDMVCSTEIFGADASLAQCCGAKPFNTKTQMCCRNDVYEKSGVTLCCNDKVVDNANSSLSCCGGVLYKPKQELCCKQDTPSPGDEEDKKAYPRYGIHAIVGTATMCCGIDPIDPVTHMCCDHKPVAKPKDAKEPVCCGSLVIDGQKQLCCDGNVINKTSVEMKCCGDQVYNDKSELCCAGKTTKRTMDISCCEGGKQVYNVNTQACCFDGVLDLTPEDISNSKTTCC